MNEKEFELKLLEREMPFKQKLVDDAAEALERAQENYSLSLKELNDAKTRQFELTKELYDERSKR